MELIAVESSHVAAIGYLETDRVLLVRYRDGSLYAQPNVAPEEFAALQSAPSKGQWLYTRDRKGVSPVCVRKGGQTEDRSQSKERVASLAAETTGPLNVIDEEADKCCRKAFALVGQAGSIAGFSCPQCGTDFHRETIGELQYWRIVPQVTIVRPR